MLWAPGDTDRQLHAAEHFPQAGHGSVQTIAAPTSTSAGAITNHATKTGPPEWLSMCVGSPGVCVRERKRSCSFYRFVSLTQTREGCSDGAVTCREPVLYLVILGLFRMFLVQFSVSLLDLT